MKVKTDRPLALLLATLLLASCKQKQPPIPPPKFVVPGTSAQSAATKPHRRPPPFTDFARVANVAMPAVVYIYALKEEPRPSFLSLLYTHMPFWRAAGYWLNSRITQTYQTAASGSGFLINKRGFILTNFHVVEGADKIVVRVKHGNETEELAEQLGADPMSDVALIKIGPDYRYATLNLGDSDALEVGERVAAIGNPFDVGKTFTTGVVSALRREDIGILELEDFIQTDAAINPGNSGGPLVDVNGDAIGINSVIYSDASRVGFAVPINIAKAILPKLAGGERIDRGMLGVGLEDLSPQEVQRLGLQVDERVLVATVTRGSPAQKAGILPGDVITSFNGQKITHYYELKKSVVSLPAGVKVAVTLVRSGKTKTVTAKLARLERKP